MQEIKRGRPGKLDKLRNVSLYLDSELIDFVDQYCDKYHLQRSALLRLLIQNLKDTGKHILSSGGIGCEK